jgi:hypothetical protein
MPNNKALFATGAITGGFFLKHIFIVFTELTF